MYLLAPWPSSSATEVRAPDGTLRLQEWAALVEDRRLLYPLAVAYTQLPWWRPVAQLAARRRTTVAVQRDTGVGGYYRFNQIVVDESVLAEPIDVQAAVLVHEFAHVTSPRVHVAGFPLLRLTIFGARLCFEEERDAFYRGTVAYRDIIRPPGIDTAWTRAHDQLLAALEHDRLGEEVVRMPDYQQAYLGGTIR